MRTINLFVLIFISALVSPCAAQLLSVDEAVAIALKVDYDILVSKNDALIAKTNNTPGNAGMLPDVSVSASAGIESKNVSQKYPDASIREYNPQNIHAASAGVQLSWTLFDGGRMFIAKNRLSQLQRLGEIEFQAQVLQTTADVISAYYDVVRQQQQLRAVSEAIRYNRQRLLIVQTAFRSGALGKSDLLQAQIDLNHNLESEIIQQNNIVTAKRALNKLLRKASDDVIQLADTIPCIYQPDSPALMQKLESANLPLLAWQKQVDVARQNYKEARTGYLPLLHMSAGYLATDVRNSVGTVLQNRTMGPQLTGTLSIPLYSGGENKRKTNVAKLELQSTTYNLEKTKQDARTGLQNAISDFKSQFALLRIEEENYRLCDEYLKISIKRLQLGQTTSLEVHLAQENYVQSATRLINYRYNLKMAETKIKHLISAL